MGRRKDNAGQAFPFNRERAGARFRRLKGRSVEIDLVPSGIVVDAKTPAELETETNREIVRRAGTTRN